MQESVKADQTTASGVCTVQTALPGAFSCHQEGHPDLAGPNGERYPACKTWCGNTDKCVASLGAEMAEVKAMTEPELDAELRQLGVEPDSAPERVKRALRGVGLAIPAQPSSVTASTPNGCPACEFEDNKPCCTRRAGCVVWGIPGAALGDASLPAHNDHPMRHWDRTCPACNPRVADLSAADKLAYARAVLDAAGVKGGAA